jgi:hypothetical protein
MGLKEIADWKHIGTVTILALASVVGSIILFGWQLYWDVETPATGLKDAFANHLTESEGENQGITKALTDIAKVLGEVRTEQQEAYKRDLTIRGLGAAGSFGGTEKYVRINSDSDANLYRDGDTVRITKITEGGRASEVFEVRGEWTHPDSAVLVSFSQAACDALEVTGIVKVQLEPVLKK